MDVSIIIAVYNAEKRIEMVVDRLVSQDYRGSYDIYLVNDGSTDKTLDVLRRLEKKHRIITVIDQKNAGAAAARNRGIKASKGKITAIIDDDCILEKGWLSKMLSKLNKNVGFVISNIKNAELNNPSYVESVIFDYAMASRDAIKDSTAPMGMCNVSWKHVFEKAGLYPPETKGSGVSADDVIIEKIKKLGYKIEIAYGTVAIHLEGKERFRFFYLLKKGVRWGEDMMEMKKKFGIGYSGWYFLSPLPVMLLVLFAGLMLININFVLLLIPGILAYVYLRRALFKNLIKMGTRIDKIILILFIDIVRGLSYSIGTILYYLRR